MSRRYLQCPALLAAFCLFFSFAPIAAAQETLGEIEDTGLERNSERRETQQRVDAISGRTREIVDSYRAELKIVQGLETYVDMLGQQLDGQAEEIATLQTSITDVAVVERQILPLMARMLDGLEQFIELDVPFLLEERRGRVSGLRELLGRSDVTVAEKSRRVFEAFQVENDFGRTIETYRGKLALDSGSFDADFLRVGRIALLYQTVGDENVGYWNAAEGRWDPLPATPYQRLMRQGLKVAGQEIAPELISIPLNPAEVAAP